MANFFFSFILIPRLIYDKMQIFKQDWVTTTVNAILFTSKKKKNLTRSSFCNWILRTVQISSKQNRLHATSSFTPRESVQNNNKRISLESSVTSTGTSNKF